MPSHRMLRVRELLKREIGEILRRELPVNQAGLITVNDVDLSGDLRTAKVYVSFLGSSEQQRTGLVLLQQNRPRIQGLMAKAVFLKYIPRLHFVVDDSVLRGNRVLEIIADIEKTAGKAEDES
ncbi:MAG TPA: 30S ribosome-binding factor RbfA [Candidatus Binatia bacterium]|nr:30S ribosome-binding factor RbfA [Candidatus Binatia bacterium]